MKRLLALMVMLLAYPGNADTIIDGSSQETFQKSIKEMIESYASSEMKEAFSTALLKKLWAKDPLTANLSGLALMAVIPQAAETMHITLDGVRQSEIERVILESVDLKDPQDSDAKEISTEPNCDLDEHISILVKDIKFEDEYFGSGKRAEVTISITNTGPFAISAYAVSYSLKTEGRMVPWETDDFYFSSVPGGIEPNETISDKVVIRELYDPRIRHPLSVSLEVVDVRDYQKRFLRKPKNGVMGYPDEVTKLDCFETGVNNENRLPKKYELTTETELPKPKTDPVSAALDEVLKTRNQEPVLAEPLAEQFIRGMQLAIAECWNLGALSSAALSTIVVVEMELTLDGKPVPNSIKMLGYSGEDERSAAVAFEAAVNAITGCGAQGFELPKDQYANWRRVELTFNPEKMRVR